MHDYKYVNKFYSTLCVIQSFIFLQRFNSKIYQTRATIFKIYNTFKINFTKYLIDFLHN